MSGMLKVVAAIAVTAAAIATGGASAANGSKPPSLEFLGQAIVPTGTTFAGTTVGGLSSITYDRSRGVFYSLSDDQGQFNPARFYTLRVDVSDGHLDPGDVTFTGVTTLLAPDCRTRRSASTPRVSRWPRAASSSSPPRGSRRVESRPGCVATPSTGRFSPT
jgi:hypothetical protein